MALLIAVAAWMVGRSERRMLPSEGGPQAPKPGVEQAARSPADQRPTAEEPQTPADAPSGEEDEPTVAGQTPPPGSLPSQSGYCPEPGAPALRPSLREVDKVSADAFRTAAPLVHTPRFRDAITAFATYVRGVPADTRTAQQLARLRTQAEIQDGFAHVEERGVWLDYPPDLLSTNQALSALHIILRSLDDVAELTQTERRASLYAVIYRDRSELLAVTCTPSWAAGLYDGTLRIVAAADSPDGVSTNDVRHEATHAQVIPLGRAEPIWFQEGLAQYVADFGAFKWTRAFELMLRNRTYVPFRSLEQSFLVFDGTNDAALAYQQSIAMVHWLVDVHGKQGIAQAVAALRKGALPSSLLTQLSLTEEQGLLDYLAEQRPQRLRQ